MNIVCCTSCLGMEYAGLWSRSHPLCQPSHPQPPPRSAFAHNSSPTVVFVEGHFPLGKRFQAAGGHYWSATFTIRYPIASAQQPLLIPHATLRLSFMAAPAVLASVPATVHSRCAAFQTFHQRQHPHLKHTATSLRSVAVSLPSLPTRPPDRPPRKECTRDQLALHVFGDREPSSASLCNQS